MAVIVEGPAVDRSSGAPETRSYSDIRNLAATLAALGILSLGPLESTPRLADDVALGSIVLLGVAVVLTVLPHAAPGPDATHSDAVRAGYLVAEDGASSPTVRRWRAPGAWVAGTIALVAVQTWFGLHDVAIAGGDLSPPLGTAWIGRLFSPWVSGGSNLGAPANLELDAPWAVVLQATHLVGGSPAVAERLWCTLAFVGAALAVYALLRLLDVHEIACTLGSLAYCFNPFVLTSIGANPLYLAALALIPVLATIVLAGASGRISVRRAAVAIGVCSPLVGYTFQNPPLAVMAAVTLLVTPVIALAVGGKEEGRRGLRVLLWGGGLLAALSAYWAVPALLTLNGAATSSLSGASSWTWTETRSTLANALWLNTTWAWNPTYFPFSASYARFPLAVGRYAVAALAFAGLPMGAMSHKHRVRRAAPLLAGTAILLLLMSTGTRSPGNLIFDPLYRLPLGWLLREPGRLLLFVGLSFAVLVAFAADRALSIRRPERGRGTERAPVRGRPWGVVAPSLAAGAVILGVALPLVSGSLVHDATSGTYGASRVSVPTYWSAMARDIDLDPSGRVMVLPAVDYYQVGYRWGYHGTDAFIGQMVVKPVLDPNAQGYYPAQQQLLQAVKVLATAASQRDWVAVRDMAIVTGTTQLLVRGDLQGPDGAVAGRLASALRRDPEARLLSRRGPLWLFGLPAPVGKTTVTTIDTANPDLRLLPLLPAGTRLVSHAMMTGTPAVIEPSVQQWRIGAGGRITMSVPRRPGWRYSATALPADPGLTSGSAATRRTLRTAMGSSPQGPVFVMSVPAASLLPDGAFTAGPWQRVVGDCNRSVPGDPGLGASVVRPAPGGAALQLTAEQDSACEAKPVLGWRGGPVVVDMLVRRVAGLEPRVCLWEVGANQCASAPPVVTRGATWSPYRSLVAPDPGTTGLSLFVYADGAGGEAATVSDYAHVSVSQAASLPVAIATPVRPRPVQLIALDDSYSTRWHGPGGAPHVLVDGITNGWLVRSASGVRSPVTYAPSGIVAAGQLLSLVVAVGLGGFAVATAVRRRRAGVGRR